MPPCVLAFDARRLKVCLERVVARHALREHATRLVSGRLQIGEDRLSARRDRQDISPLRLGRLSPQPDQRPVGVDIVPPQRSQLNESIKPSMSVGIASRTETRTDSGEALLRAADTALYASKSAGKGCTTVWSEDTGRRAAA